MVFSLLESEILLKRLLWEGLKKVGRCANVDNDGGTPIKDLNKKKQKNFVTYVKWFTIAAVMLMILMVVFELKIRFDTLSYIYWIIYSCSVVDNDNGYIRIQGLNSKQFHWITMILHDDNSNGDDKVDSKNCDVKIFLIGN